MKTMKSLCKFAAIAAVALAFTACSEDKPEAESTTVNLEKAGITYNDNGYWADCYNAETGAFTVDGVTFSHQAGSEYYAEWDYYYYYWNGFCPSKVSDTVDHTADGWAGLNEWAAITGGSINGAGKPYLVGFWKSDEVDTYSCNIKLADAKPFLPREVYVTNNTYAYYTMVNGDNYSKKFDDSDWFKLIIKGVSNGGFSGEVVVDLAKGTQILDTWLKVDLSSLGYVDALVMKLESSDTGEWGMNTPGYFCMDAFSYSR